MTNLGENKLYAAIDNRKVAIIGSGFVGASIAYALTIRDLASEIILVDSDKEKASGEALKLSTYSMASHIWERHRFGKGTTPIAKTVI